MLIEDIKFALLTYPEVITSLDSLVAAILQLLLSAKRPSGHSCIFWTQLYRQQLAQEMERTTQTATAVTEEWT